MLIEDNEFRLLDEGAIVLAVSLNLCGICLLQRAKAGDVKRLEELSCVGRQDEKNDVMCIAKFNKVDCAMRFVVVDN